MSIADSFNNLPPKQKRIVMAVSAIVLVLGVSFLLASVTERKSGKNPRAEKPEVNVVSPARTTGVESFTAKMALMEKDQAAMQAKFALLQKSVGDSKSPEKSASKDELKLVDDDLPALTPSSSVFEAPTSKPPELPPPPAAAPVAQRPVVAGPGSMQAPGEGADMPTASVSAPSGKAIRIFGESGEIAAGRVEEVVNKPPVLKAKDTNANESAYIPAGSMFTGVLLSGLDAPTSAVAQKNPTPVVIRVKREALLPNYASIDVQECFLIAAGYGQLSSERALMRAENLSCVRSDGQVIESKLDAYIVGPDGKVGIPGRLVSKQGQMIAQSLVAGALGGIGQSLTRSKVPALNINPAIGQDLYQSDSVSSIGQSGLAGGLSSATNMIAKFYLDMAKETFPVVEIPAGEVATIIVTRGASLPLKGSTSLQRYVDPAERQRAGGSAPRRDTQKPVASNEHTNPAPTTAGAAGGVLDMARATAGAAQAAAKPTFENGLGWNN